MGIPRKQYFRDGEGKSVEMTPAEIILDGIHDEWVQRGMETKLAGARLFVAIQQQAPAVIGSDDVREEFWLWLRS